MRNTSRNTSLQRFVIWQTVVVFTALLVVGCRKDRNIGLEIQPEGSLDRIQIKDDFLVRGRTIISDAQPSSQYRNFVGSIYNDVFGRSTAEVYVQFELNNENIGLENPPEDYVVDSVRWVIYPFVHYGNLWEDLTLSVYMLDDAITADSVYRSDVQLKYDAHPLGIYTFPFKTQAEINDTLIAEAYSGERIHLDNDLGSFLLQGVGRQYTNSDQLQSYFKGLVLRLDNPEAMNPGIIHDFTFAGTSIGLFVYYHQASDPNTELDPLQFRVTNSSSRINRFENDYSGSEVEPFIGSTAMAKEKLFVQGMSGVKCILEFPELVDFGVENDVVLSLATLSVFTDEGQPSGLARSERLYLLDRVVNSEGDTIETYNLDYLTSNSRHGGILEEDGSKYLFDVTRTVQRIIEEAQVGNDVNTGFTLNAQVPVLNDNVVTQNVLKGTDNIVLTLYYTDIKE